MTTVGRIQFSFSWHYLCLELDRPVCHFTQKHLHPPISWLNDAQKIKESQVNRHVNVRPFSIQEHNKLMPESTS